MRDRNLSTPLHEPQTRRAQDGVHLPSAVWRCRHQTHSYSGRLHRRRFRRILPFPCVESFTPLSNRLGLLKTGSVQFRRRQCPARPCRILRFPDVRCDRLRSRSILVRRRELRSTYCGHSAPRFVSHSSQGRSPIASLRPTQTRQRVISRISTSLKNLRGVRPLDHHATSNVGVRLCLGCGVRRFVWRGPSCAPPQRASADFASRGLSRFPPTPRTSPGNHLRDRPNLPTHPLLAIVSCRVRRSDHSSRPPA